MIIIYGVCERDNASLFLNRTTPTRLEKISSSDPWLFIHWMRPEHRIFVRKVESNFDNDDVDRTS